MIYKVNESYEQLWQETEDPKLVHFLYRDKETSLHPLVMQSNDAYSELLYVLEGSCEIFVDGKAYEVQAGDFIVYNAGVAHDQKMAPGEVFVYYALAFNGFKWPRCRENCLVPDHLSPHLRSARLSQASRPLLDLLLNYLREETVPGRERTLHYLSQAILAQFKERYLLRYPPDDDEAINEEIPLATRVRAYLDEHFCEDITLQSLAERFNISTFYLSHIFKDQFGYPPLQYILRRRIGLAQTLLITTDLPVGEIGTKVGYLYPSHFNLIFTKNVGTSPRKYRMNYIN